MNPELAFRIEQLVTKLRISDGTLIDLAREVSHKGSLVHFGELTRRDACELWLLLRQIESGERRLADMNFAEQELAYR